MRVKYIRKDLKNINDQILILGGIFIISLLFGTFLNKIWPSYSQNILNDLNLTVEHYSKDISIIENVILNLKSDFLYMISISVFFTFVISFPVSIIFFIIKGVSIGYTINTVILALKFSSFKMVFLTVFKNIILVPGMIILLVISINHIKELSLQVNKKRKENIVFLSKRYLINAVLISIGVVLLQSVVNILSIAVVKLFS